jgi:sodium transport system permease protein
VIERGRLVAWTAFVALFAALSYALNFTTENPKDVLYTWAAAVSGLVQYAFILGVVLLISRGAARRLLALRRPRSWPAAIGLGIAVVFGAFVLGALLSPFVDPGREQGLLPESWEPARAAAFAANCVVVAVVAPIVEELLFRGLGFSLLAPLGARLAIPLVGLAFGLAHGLVEALPLLVAFGGALAYIRHRTGSVVPGMLVHALFNGIALAAAVSGG